MRRRDTKSKKREQKEQEKRKEKRKEKRNEKKMAPACSCYNVMLEIN
jgi:hypothetical protein